MQKTHVRSYRISEAGDIAVSHFLRGEVVDLSKHYAAEPHDRRHSRVEAELDVFRYADDQLAFSLVPNGQDVDSAMTARLLLNLYLEDVDRSAGDPRAL